MTTSVLSLSRARACVVQEEGRNGAVKKEDI
jgi:hypothetical protein